MYARTYAYGSRKCIHALIFLYGPAPLSPSLSLKLPLLVYRIRLRSWPSTGGRTAAAERYEAQYLNTLTLTLAYLMYHTAPPFCWRCLGVQQSLQVATERCMLKGKVAWAGVGTRLVDA